jgi:type II secretory pathway pseudopilin PulG
MENGKWKMLSAECAKRGGCSVDYVRGARGGFTLVQMLVVIGILAGLMALVLPAILKAYATGVRTRTEADLHLIETALEAYKQDFGDYPRFATATADQADFANMTPGNGTWLDYQPDRGALLLCRALLGPGPGPKSTSLVTDAAAPGEDGADGPGFRSRRNLMAGTGGTVAAGKVWGPYVQPDKFKLGHTNTLTSPPTAADTTNFTDAVLVDHFENPILYYPSNGPIPTTALSQYVTVVNPASSNVTTYYNAFDNAGVGTTATPSFLKPADMQKFMYANNPSGMVATGKTIVSTNPYLLWTAGADGIFGANVKGKTDDVTNFDIPPEFKK